MALAQVGGGYQVGDGNLNELQLEASAAPQTATATATLTVAQITGNMLVANPSTTAATYTLPTAALIDAAVTNAKVGSIFDLSIINIGTSTGTVTLATATGITDGGNAFIVVPITSSAVFRFRKTGDAAYTVYKVA
jgi:ABC-type polysaccharide transport system permease subunit